MAIAEAIAGERLGAQIRNALGARKQMTFQAGENGARFENAGAPVSVRLKNFTLKIPERIRGRAQLLEDGVELRFDGHHAPTACKLFFCVRVERLELTQHSIFVDMEGESLDQRFEFE